MFTVVIFLTDNKVEAVPTLWIKSDSECFWPPYTDLSKISRAIAKKKSPGPDWEIYSIRKLRTYGMY